MAIFSTTSQITQSMARFEMLLNVYVVKKDLFNVQRGEPMIEICKKG